MSNARKRYYQLQGFNRLLSIKISPRDYGKTQAMKQTKKGHK